MSRSGMSPYQVLRSGTESAGLYLHQAAGTITLRNRADLVLLEANPLTDLDSLKRQVGVMGNGRWLVITHSRSARQLPQIGRRLIPCSDEMTSIRLA